jgi:ABC-type polysaccharide/polyol phosphate transport system ATPase subunit
MTVIAVRGVGKQYVKIEDRPSVGRELGVLRRTRRTKLWAVRGVDFEVREGESVGVLGRNGAGKTTLLSMLAGLTAPSEGRLTVRGRVAPLISVGVGFHPDLTGRENVHLNAAVLGMTPAQVTARFDEIVDFSGIEAFIDAPAKTYSSGMYVRLGFAVAVCATPEVLLVDEVLGVGDVEFQRRCFDRLAEMRLEGTTIVAVSHNLTALQVFSDRGLVLDKGRLLFDGPIAEAVGSYLTTLDDVAYDGPGADSQAVSVQLLRPDGSSAANVRSGEQLVVRLTVRRPSGDPAPRIRVALQNDRVVVWERVLRWAELARRSDGHEVEADLTLPLPLVSGTYSVVAGVVDGDLVDTAPSTETALHVTAGRVVHGTLDLRARLVP